MLNTYEIIFSASSYFVEYIKEMMTCLLIDTKKREQLDITTHTGNYFNCFFFYKKERNRNKNLN